MSNSVLEIKDVVDTLEAEIRIELEKRGFVVIGPKQHFFTEDADICLLCGEELGMGPGGCQRGVWQ
jgi:hypothetical protein